MVWGWGERKWGVGVGLIDRMADPVDSFTTTTHRISGCRSSLPPFPFPLPLPFPAPAPPAEDGAAGGSGDDGGWIGPSPDGGGGGGYGRPPVGRGW